MAEYKVGGRVICIERRILQSSAGQIIEYKKNSVYEVKAIAGCSCSFPSLWLGDMLSKGDIRISECAFCNAQLARDGRIFVISTSFLPLDDFKEVTFTEIKKEVPVSAQ